MKVSYSTRLNQKADAQNQPPSMRKEVNTNPGFSGLLSYGSTNEANPSPRSNGLLSYRATNEAINTPYTNQLSPKPGLRDAGTGAYSDAPRTSNLSSPTPSLRDGDTREHVNAPHSSRLLPITPSLREANTGARIDAPYTNQLPFQPDPRDTGTGARINAPTNQLSFQPDPRDANTSGRLEAPRTSRLLSSGLRNANTNSLTSTGKHQFVKPGNLLDAQNTALVETTPSLPSQQSFPRDSQEMEIRATRPRSFSLAGVQNTEWGKTISTPLVARILKIGVGLSASLIILGVLLLPQSLQQISEWWLIAQPHVITVGLLALIATPVLSVTGSLVTFIRQKDLQYVTITSIVLAILLYSLFFLGGLPKDQLPAGSQALDLSMPTLLLVFVGSFTAGVIGSLAGLGGGVLLVPLLTIFFHVPIEFAIGASIVSVIATSSGAAIAYVRDRLTNVRVAMVLQIGTTLGALSGVFLAGLLSPNVIGIIFGIMLLISIAPMIFKLAEELPRGVVNDRIAAYFKLSGSYPDKRLGQEVHYQVQRTPAGFALMFVAGAVSGLLGIGSGSFKVLALDTLMRLPMKVSSATSNLMIGVTAAASAGIYFSRGNIVPLLSAPVALGVLLGAFLGARLLVRLSNKTLRYIFLPVLAATAIEMILHGIGIGPY